MDIKLKDGSRVFLTNIEDCLDKIESELGTNFSDAIRYYINCELENQEERVNKLKNSLEDAIEYIDTGEHVTKYDAEKALIIIREHLEGNLC